MSDLLVVNIGALATPEGRTARGGAAQGEVRFLHNAWVRIEGGVITGVGEGAPPEIPGAARLDAGGRLVTPGLVDAHTHLIFGGWRNHEMALKLQEVPYLDILAQGGGSDFTPDELSGMKHASMDDGQHVIPWEDQ